jgi:chromosome segregation ATPase
MNKLNDIFKKIAKMEQNANEVKLGKHEVELAIADKLKVELKKYTSLISQSGKDLDNYYTAIREIEKTINQLKGQSQGVSQIAQELRKQEDLVSSEIEIVTKKVNEAKSELGINININELVDLSGLQSSNTLSSRIQNDANAYLKYVNTLQKPTI